MWRSLVRKPFLLLFICCFLAYFTIGFTRTHSFHHGGGFFPPDHTYVPAAGSDDVYDEPPIVAISLWFGGRTPSYVPEFFRTIYRNKNITLLVPALMGTDHMCPETKPETYILYKQNIKFVCMSKTEMMNLFADKMCKVWECSPDEILKFRQVIYKFLEDPYAITELKVAYATVFEDHIGNWTGRRQPFSHWLRIDMDTLVGDLDRLMPWGLLKQFDVIVLKPPEYKSFWFPGASTIYRIHPRVDKIWTAIWGLQTPLSFSQIFAKKPDLAQCESPYGASDEGALTKAILTSPDVTWIQLSHFLFWFAYNRYDGLEYHTDVRGGDVYKSLIMAPDVLTWDQTLSLHRDAPPTASDFSPYDDSIILQFHGKQRVTWQCPKDMLGQNLEWVVPSGRICLEDSHLHPPEPENSITIVYRNQTLGPVWRATVKDPLTAVREMTVDGQKKMIRYRNIPVLHLFVTKKKAQFRQEPLVHNEALRIYANRTEIRPFSG